MSFTTSADYPPENTLRIRKATLTVATILGDYIEDIVVVGGLVPSLLIPQTELPAGAENHAGTLDLDLGLDLAILNDQRYKGIAQHLRRAGFYPDTKEGGNGVRQRWTHGQDSLVKIEFLIPPVSQEADPGRLQSLEQDLAAFITDGLEIAFRNRVNVRLEGTTLFDESVSREIPVCNPGAFVVLKALALKNRGDFKDAYDLYYVTRNYGKGVEDVAAYLAPLVETRFGQKAIDILKEDFHDERALGPMRVARFATGDEDPAMQADVVGFISDLLQELRR
jgi:hypothetical protein